METVHELGGAWRAFALKAGRRSSVSAFSCAMRQRFSSGVTLMPPRGCLLFGRLTDLESGPHRGRVRVSLPERLGVSAVLYYESGGGRGEGVVHFASPKGGQVAVKQH